MSLWILRVNSFVEDDPGLKVGTPGLSASQHAPLLLLTCHLILAFSPPFSERMRLLFSVDSIDPSLCIYNEVSVTVSMTSLPVHPAKFSSTFLELFPF